MDELKQRAADNISSRIKSFIDERGLTNDEVAQEIGCSRTALYQKLRGNSSFSLYEGYLLSRMLGCSIEEFFTIG